jgi:hypothetical protein
MALEEALAGLGIERCRPARRGLACVGGGVMKNRGG